MKKLQIIKKLNREQIILLIVVLLIFPVILLATGTITSGWHFTDDHETVMLVEQKVENGVTFCQAFRKAYLGDITHRWRPAYWFFRVMGAYVFGVNYVMHNLFLCVIGMITYLFLYGTARNFKCSSSIAHLFAGLAALGRQYEIWFRIANQENAGLFFLSICLWIISKQYKDNLFGKRKYDVLLLTSAVICSLIKESFFLLLPGIVLLRLVLEGITIDGRWKKWILLLIRRSFFWLPALLAFMWSAYMIVFYVGTAPLDYAGVDIEEGGQQIIWDIMRLPKESLEDFVKPTMAATVILLISLFFLVAKRKKVAIDSIVCGFFGIYIMATQIILYAKSGMWDRYLVPFTVGYGVFFLILAEKLLQNKYIRMIYSFLLTAFLISRIYVLLVSGAIPYGEEGKQIQAMLQYTISETTEESSILVSLGGRESDVATCMYLEDGKRSKVYICDNTSEMYWQEQYNCETDELGNYDWEVLILDADADNSFLEGKVVTSSWERRQFGECFTVWTKGK